MTIRRARSEDAKRISYLIQKNTDRNPNDYSKEQIIAWKKYNTPSQIKKQLENRVVFCAFKNDRLIGTIALKDNFVLGFYVSYTARGTGIGTELLDYLEKYAIGEDVKKLKLISTPSAFKFYKKRGYKSIKNVISSVFGVEYTEVEMEKNIG